MLKRLMVLLGGLLVISGAVASPRFEEQTLRNGLRIIVRPDHRAPVVVTSIWYRVGGSYEHWGNTGISHLLEHLMFKGTRAYPDGAFSRKVAEVGGDENAMTSDDFTAYYQRVSPKYLPLMLRMEADRMRHLRVSQQQFEHELKVVKEERRLRVDDQPTSLMRERFNAVANLPGPYIHGPVGWPADLDHMTRYMAMQWYDHWYQPNNAVIVVVGDVQPATVFHWAKHYFGGIPMHAIPTERIYRGHAAWGPQCIRVQAHTKVPMLMSGYAVPVLNTAKSPVTPWALELLSNALGNGNDSGRLAKHLVHGRQLLSMAMAYYDLGQRGNTQFTLIGIPSKGHTLTEAKKAIRQEVVALSQHAVSPEELARLKQVASAEYIYSQDSMMSQAIIIGRFAAVGLPVNLVDQWVTHLKAVRADQMQQAAKAWLQPGRRTVALMPTS